MMESLLLYISFFPFRWSSCKTTHPTRCCCNDNCTTHALTPLYCLDWLALKQRWRVQFAVFTLHHHMNLVLLYVLIGCEEKKNCIVLTLLIPAWIISIALNHLSTLMSCVDAETLDRQTDGVITKKTKQKTNEANFNPRKVFYLKGD